MNGQLFAAAVNTGVPAMLAQPLVPASASSSSSVNLAGRSPRRRSSRAVGSTPTAFINFFKQNFGSGILALPRAFVWAGLYGGTAAFLLVVVLCIYSQLLLVESFGVVRGRARRSLDDDEEDDDDDTLPGIGRAAFGRRAGVAIGVLVVVLQGCFCVGWFIAAADQVMAIAPLSALLKRDQWLLGVFMPFVAALSCVPFVHKLWPLSAFGLATYSVGVIGVTLAVIIGEVAKGTAPVPPVTPVVWRTLPLFIGSASYSLEGILMVMPIVASMRRPEHAAYVVAGGDTCYGLIALVFSSAAYVFGFGSCGGDVVECIPPGPATTVVRIALAITLLTGLPIYLFPISDAINSWVARAARRPTPAAPMACAPGGTTLAAPPADHTGDDEQALAAARRRDWLAFVQVSVVRILIVVACASLAAYCTNFARFSSIVGSVLTSVVGFVIPPAIHAQLCLRRKPGPEPVAPARGADARERSGGASFARALSAAGLDENCAFALAKDAMLVVFGASVCVMGLLTRHDFPHPPAPSPNTTVLFE